MIREKKVNNKPLLEKEVQKKIVKYLKDNDFLMYVTTGGFYGNNGVSDILAWKKGKAYAFEVKRKPGMKATPIQASWIKDALRHGVIAKCVGSVDEVETVIKYYNN